jgi:hypothetical protein
MYITMSKFPLDYYSSAQEGGGIRTEQIPAKLSLLVLDSIDSPAHFVLLELISTALRADRPVILLLSEDGQQQEEYWLSLLQKNRITRQQQQQLLTITTIIPLEPLEPLLQLLQASSHHNPLLIINSLSSIIWDNNQPSHQLTHTFRSLLPSQLSVSKLTTYLITPHILTLSKTTHIHSPTSHSSTYSTTTYSKPTTNETERSSPISSTHPISSSEPEH